MNIFQSILHDIYTQLKNKIALTPHDDKRFVIPGTFRTLAWDHKSKILKPILELNDNDEVNELTSNTIHESRIQDNSLDSICEKLILG